MIGIRKGEYLSQPRVILSSKCASFVVVDDGLSFVCRYCGKFMSCPLVPCSNGCHSIYCSNDCLQDDLIHRGHVLFCSQRNYRHCRALQRFIMSTSIQKFLQLSLMILASRICNSKDYFHKKHSEMSSNLILQDGSFTIPSEYLEESWVLIVSILTDEKLEAIARLTLGTYSTIWNDSQLAELAKRIRSCVSLTHWNGIVLEVMENSISIAVEHPLASRARQLPQLPSAALRLRKLKELLPYYGQIIGREGQTTKVDKGNVQESLEEILTNADVSVEKKAILAERAMTRLAQAAAIGRGVGGGETVAGEVACNPFDALGAELLVIHPDLSIEVLPHSCLPSALVEARPVHLEGALELRVLALCDQKSPLLSIDRNEEGAGGSRRQGLPACRCALCRYENLVGSLSQNQGDLSVEELLAVGELYLGQGKHSTAIALLEAALELEERRRRDGVQTFEDWTWGRTVHALGAAYLALGRWRIAHETWLRVPPVAGDLCPLPVELEEIRAKLWCYPHVRVGEATAVTASVAPQVDGRRTVSMELDGREGDGWETLLDGSIFLSPLPVISLQQCQAFINEAEEESVRSGFGWTTQRHYAAPTTDIPLHRLPQALAWFNVLWRDTIAPSLLKQFLRSGERKGPVYLSIHDAFLVRYRCEEEWDLVKRAYEGNAVEELSEVDPATSAQRHLPLHTDESTLSFVLPLNAPSGDPGFVGGGTYFAALQKAVVPPAGHLLSFKGGCLVHGGEPLLAGTRYIIAGFVLLQDDRQEIRPFSERQLGKRILLNDDDSGRLSKSFSFHFSCDSSSNLT